MPHTAARLTRLLAIAYTLTWVVNRSLRRVDGDSMRPTLVPGQLLLVLPPAVVPPRRGAVVVVPDPRSSRRRTVKRVVGVAGEVVELVAGELHVAGIAHDEPYVVAVDRSTARWEPGAGELVVLGDDRTASTDSRAFGPVTTADVVAVAVMALRPWRRLWPPTPPRPRRPPRS